MKKRILAVIALVLLFGGTSLAFGYWDNLEQDLTGETVVISEGVVLTVASGVHADDTKVLVPSGVVMKANDVTSYVITYDVALDTAAVNDLDLTVTASNILINGENTYTNIYTNLIDVDISAPAKINSTTVTVTITVTFTGEPADITAYTAVATGDITFDLNFLAEIA